MGILLMYSVIMPVFALVFKKSTLFICYCHKDGSLILSTDFFNDLLYVSLPPCFAAPSAYLGKLSCVLLPCPLFYIRLCTAFYVSPAASQTYLPSPLSSGISRSFQWIARC